MLTTSVEVYDSLDFIRLELCFKIIANVNVHFINEKRKGTLSYAGLTIMCLVACVMIHPYHVTNPTFSSPHPPHHPCSCPCPLSLVSCFLSLIPYPCPHPCPHLWTLDSSFPARSSMDQQGPQNPSKGFPIDLPRHVVSFPHMLLSSS